jgi:outer membrane protein TolC
MAGAAGCATNEPAKGELAQFHLQFARMLMGYRGYADAWRLQYLTDLAKLPGPVPAGMPLQSLERRPDLIAAERRVAAAFNRVGEAKAAQLPRLNLNANIAAISSDILQLREDFDNPTGGLGANLLAPIYQGGALKTQVEIRTLEQKQALAEYARLALRAGVQAHVWVGGQERPLFLWQARLLSERWGCGWSVEPGRHHFDVIDGLEAAEYLAGE